MQILLNNSAFVLIKNKMTQSLYKKKKRKKKKKWGKGQTIFPLSENDRDVTLCNVQSLRRGFQK